MSELTIGDSLIMNTDYSESEVKTGATWIDGKPIYRKVLTGTTASSGGAGGRRTIAHGINDLGKMLLITGGIEPSSAYTQQLNYYFTSSNYSAVFKNGANIVQESGTSSPLDAPMWIVLYYTKTTD